jgi:hypothetical protein
MMCERPNPTSFWPVPVRSRTLVALAPIERQGSDYSFATKRFRDCYLTGPEAAALIPHD